MKDIINKKCYACGHDRFITRTNSMKCARCKRKPTRLETFKDKTKRVQMRAVLDERY